MGYTFSLTACLTAPQASKRTTMSTAKHGVRRGRHESRHENLGYPHDKSAEHRAGHYAYAAHHRSHESLRPYIVPIGVMRL